MQGGKISGVEYECCIKRKICIYLQKIKDAIEMTSLSDREEIQSLERCTLKIQRMTHSLYAVSIYFFCEINTFTIIIQEFL